MIPLPREAGISRKPDIDWRWLTPGGTATFTARGNTFVPTWNGCPPEAMQKIGVSLDLMNNTKWGK